VCMKLNASPKSSMSVYVCLHVYVCVCMWCVCLSIDVFVRNTNRWKTRYPPHHEDIKIWPIERAAGVATIRRFLKTYTKTSNTHKNCIKWRTAEKELVLHSKQTSTHVHTHTHTHTTCTHTHLQLQWYQIL